MAAIDQPKDVAHLTDQRDRPKLHTFTSARSELLFARRALLVEGPGDVAAASLCAAGLGLDPDAEDLSIVECGGKSAIPFIASVCGALGIPYCVLHDEDAWPVPEDPVRAGRVRGENEAATRLNGEIAQAAVGSANVFILRPSLEAELGISRHAKEKPRLVAERLEAVPSDQWPAPLKQAVHALRGRARQTRGLDVSRRRARHCKRPLWARGDEVGVSAPEHHRPHGGRGAIGRVRSLRRPSVVRRSLRAGLGSWHRRGSPPPARGGPRAERQPVAQRTAGCPRDLSRVESEDGWRGRGCPLARPRTRIPSTRC